MEAIMVFILVGAALFLSGAVFLSLQPLRHRLSGGRFGRLRPLEAAPETLEPLKPTSGFGIKSNWPGLTLVGLGVVLMLAAVAF
jgi:hypothetical protein